MRAQLLAAALVLTIGVAGCATVAPPAPPVLTAAVGDCATMPDLTTAISLTPEREIAIHSVSAVVGSATPCVRSSGGNAAYVVFALPTDTADKTLTVGSALEPLRILSPAVSVLDAQGRVTRSFRADEFLYRNLIYSVLFRPRAEERFVMVSVDPARVGQAYDSIAIGVNQTTTYTAVGPVTISMGQDAAQQRTFSYEGTALVVVNDSDTKEEPET